MQNREITGRYLCSQLTLDKATEYLQDLRNGQKQPGTRLRTEVGQADYNALTAQELLAHLMNTRQPLLCAERSASIGEANDWTIEENAILADMIFSTTGTCAYNNGEHFAFAFPGGPSPNYPEEARPKVNFLFASGTLLRNDLGYTTSDMDELIQEDDTLNAEAYYQLIERRLLPGLLAQNTEAKKTNTPLLINIPGLGTGEFAQAKYRESLKRLLPGTLRRLFEAHGEKLDMIRVVNYDPFERLPGNEDPFSGTVHHMNLMARPYQEYDSPAKGHTAAAQLAFPKDGRDYTDFVMVKIVAWDPFSFPGNDIWTAYPDDEAEESLFGRKTDDGVAFGSSDVILAMSAMGQFGQNKIQNVEYDSTRGIVYPKDPQRPVTILLHEFAQRYACKVTSEMIEVVPFILNPRAQSVFVKNLNTKIQAMKHYANTLYPNPRPLEPSEPDAVLLPLAYQKALRILSIVEEVERKLNTFSALNPPNQTDLDQLCADIKAITDRDHSILSQHRQPLLRWLKEIVVLILTLGAPLIYTGYQAYRIYQKDPAQFSWNKVPFGLFSETKSAAKLRGLVECVDEQTTAQMRA
ncbi:MAG: hypothetical protein NTU48_04980 [Legionellales bacterium]|nr:hypothetical protein [Legionellales bacterium]